MSKRFLLAVVAALLLLRVPSLVQPMGADQGLYSYIGGRILHGELAYRDAWDQKPPAIHYIYAGLRTLSAKDLIVPAADFAAAALTAALLWGLGGQLGGPAAGAASAIVFLLLADPSFQRLGGVRVRAQCETFIALCATAALAIIVSIRPGAASRGALAARFGRMFAAGVLLGLVIGLKYNAGIYIAVALAAMAVGGVLSTATVATLAAGCAVVPGVLLTIFWRGGALGDLYQSTFVYNLRYSGETYGSRLGMAWYVLKFPIEHARVDALWLAGGAGCAILLIAGIWRRTAWIPVAWVAAACLAIAVNGSRGLPQYFVQANPALALAAGVAGVAILGRLPQVLCWTLVGLAAYGCARVDDFTKYGSSIWYDAKYLAGRTDRRTYLSRYGGQRDSDKYAALDQADLGAWLAGHSRPGEAVFVFGFSSSAYVYADRRSASRFFWSRPVILNFDGGDRRWGIEGLARDLEHTPPAVVVLQVHDWAPDVSDSQPFFLAQPRLAGWLRANYHPVPVIEGFSAWERNGR